ncbi:hypothetical protein [Arthrobacter sp. fls2-241-R2A-172]|uniref:hypothetical protein n=1 Tax=Arthrobacter sp. fls2-241-R2A-172 TaxID=3040325 RepID=UPI00254D3B99|nr:hypothetical protein [Arthrobacter sp. fls2-241-R2A-172]
MSETPLHPQSHEQVAVAAEWEYDTRALPAVANQVLIQHAMFDGNTGHPTGMYIHLGHVNPPIFKGEVSAGQAQSIAALPVVVVGNFYLPMQSVVALRDSLNEALRNAGVTE